jgi:Domain of unknown function (DUF4293)
MIQRIQSIWLFLAAVCVFLTMQFSTYVGNSKDDIPMTFVNGKLNPIFIICTVAVAVAILISIFFFKNRKLQIKLCFVALALQLGLMTLYFFEIKGFIGMGAYTLGSLLHIGTICFLLLAVKGIMSDEKLIKDSNRLR